MLSYFLLCVCLTLSNMNWFQLKWVGLSYKKHSTKLGIKCKFHLKYVPALPCEIWSDRLSCQRSTYVYVWVNHCIATNATGCYCFKNRQTCSKSHDVYITWSKCLSPARTQARRRWRHVANCTFNEQRDSDLPSRLWCVVSVRRHPRSWYALEGDISSI